MSKIIITADYYSGGLGDFFRSAISFYALSKKNNYKYEFNFDKRPELNICFNTNTHNKNDLKNISITKYGEYVNKYDIQNIINLLESNNVNIISNIFGIESSEYILSLVDEFNKLIKPSEIVLNEIDKILINNSLKDKEYISIHIRCGDKYLNNQDIYCKEDERLSISTCLNDIENKINHFNNNHNPNNLLLVIHSDSEILKSKFKDKYIVIDTIIQHTAIHSDTKNDMNGFISTVAEFYIMSKSKSIIQITYSGFSQWSSILGKVPLYTYANSKMLDFFDNHIKLFVNDQ